MLQSSSLEPFTNIKRHLILAGCCAWCSPPFQVPWHDLIAHRSNHWALCRKESLGIAAVPLVDMKDFLSFGIMETDKERRTQTKKDRQPGRQAGRQTGRQTNKRQTNDKRTTDRPTDRQTDRQTNKTNKQTNKTNKTNKQNKQTNKTNKQTRQAGRQASKQGIKQATCARD